MQDLQKTSHSGESYEGTKAHSIARSHRPITGELSNLCPDNRRAVKEP
jgi:hypothetical protein